MRQDQIETLILAGGLGMGLREMTGGSQPKCFVELSPGYRAIDYVLEQLNRIGMTATWSADNYYYQYDEIIKTTDHRMLWQKPGGISETIMQPGGTVLAIAPDCIFPFKDIPDMIATHRPGTVTWAVTKHECPGMERYRGMDVLENGAIIGRTNKSITRAPVTIADTNLLVSYTRKAPPRGEGENFYYDVLVRLERENLERMKRGQSSILNAYFLSGPVVDFGSAVNLAYLKDNFKVIYEKTN